MWWPDLSEDKFVYVPAPAARKRVNKPNTRIFTSRQQPMSGRIKYLSYLYKTYDDNHQLFDKMILRLRINAIADILRRLELIR